ncbi:hypothetical protein IW139_000666 [Coemansia sp. RSA 353]|nr:hypothetical protein GGH15_001597 [Coemansia sp. RSA 562]KAJ2199260.1 hypothetical protein GGH18_000616 [Coemansia sp. RSA 530]KAJ2200632.1 hypothetical protein IW144_000965 [Coemansia sp. RSA 522]KAJ2208602.1 hypothetical protein IW145_000619 [Coemansia sp. RSA 521]KAJ2230961.1 hypothetical protein EV180_000677 [Coemansia sp. RSA 518]KAJ2256126.1 hypothetical protein GGH98_001684 [Coemansia sp. RSA 454]KAJ2301048.1 hypothetical protein IW139_000666 [Coemansia sp. RSA 353]
MYPATRQDGYDGASKLPTYELLTTAKAETDQAVKAELPNIAEAYRPLDELPTLSLCKDLPVPDSYWNMTIDGLPAFVDMPQTKTIKIGESICIRVIVPAKTTNSSSSFAPFPNTPWDSVLLDLAGNTTQISVPVNLQMVDSVQNYVRHTAHVYEADVILRDADTFVPAGYIEYRDALWNSEDHVMAQPLVPEQLYVRSDAYVIVVDNGLSKHSMSNYLALPLCTEPDADGRWISADNLPFNASLALPPDNYNRVWLPYDCRLHRYSYQEFAQCLQQKHSLVHWFGDSNTRRALKKITTLGKWCSRPDEVDTQLCICNDNAEGFGSYSKRVSVIPLDIDPVTGGTLPLDSQQLGTVAANSSRIILFKWGGLTTLNNPPWESTFSPSFTQMGTPSVAIFALVNWDVAFSTRSFFTQQVEMLIEHVAQTYPTSTDIVIRTGQYFCCTYDINPQLKRKYSRLRNQYFSQYLVDEFNARFGKERRISIWDVGRISERRLYAARDKHAKLCSPNHVRAEIVDVENIVLANHMCNSPSVL